MVRACRSEREYARLRDCSTVPTPPSVAGVGHGSEPRWLTHLTGSTRAVSSVSRTRTVVTVAPCASRGPCCGRSARSGGSAAGTSAMPDVLNRAAAAQSEQSTATARAAQIWRIRSSANRPSRSTRIAIETLSTESRLTTERSGTGSSPGSRRTSLGQVPDGGRAGGDQCATVAWDDGVARQDDDGSTADLGHLAPPHLPARGQVGHEAATARRNEARSPHWSGSSSGCAS